MRDNWSIQTKKTLFPALRMSWEDNQSESWLPGWHTWWLQSLQKPLSTQYLLILDRTLKQFFLTVVLNGKARLVSSTRVSSCQKIKNNKKHCIWAIEKKLWLHKDGFWQMYFAWKWLQAVHVKTSKTSDCLSVYFIIKNKKTHTNPSVEGNDSSCSQDPSDTGVEKQIEGVYLLGNPIPVTHVRVRKTAARSTLGEPKTQAITTQESWASLGPSQRMHQSTVNYPPALWKVYQDAWQELIPRTAETAGVFTC